MKKTENNSSLILVTGGAGYIGSHTLLRLLQSGQQCVVIDNLSNGSMAALKSVEEISGKTVPFVECDIRDGAALARVFREHRFDAVLHFAGLKSVRESVAEPLRYFDANVGGTITLLEAMLGAGVKRLVFSSSATVYGPDNDMPVTEAGVTGPVNPYGESKLLVERILASTCRSRDDLGVAILRYFNPTGAHPSGRIGESPTRVPENLVPYVAQVAAGVREEVTVFGDDYDTPDGTGVRDYIHVEDLAEGHLRALEALEAGPGIRTWNLGTGRGYSVLEMIRAYEKASGRRIPYRAGPRRPGDIASCWADTGKARKELDWEARHGLERMMSDHWRWQEKHPHGYSSRD